MDGNGQRRHEGRARNHCGHGSRTRGFATKLALFAVAWVGCGGREISLGDGVANGDGGRSDGTVPCLHAQVRAAEVLWIGDTWVTLPGNQHTIVRDLARAAGAIGPNDDYTIAAAPATTMSMIAGQYAAQQATTTKVKVLVMDGGGWDTIIAGGADAAIAAAADGFAQLLRQVAADGTVEHVIYYLYPELAAIPGVKALRPLVQQACATSTVPCHFLDLQPLWAGHPEYTAADGIQASETGGALIANSLWGLMQGHCIAQ